MGILGALLSPMTEPRAWYVTISRDDAIIFEARKDIYVFGVGIYGPVDKRSHEFTINYRWII
jgi:PHR domain